VSVSYRLKQGVYTSITAFTKKYNNNNNNVYNNMLKVVGFSLIFNSHFKTFQSGTIHFFFIEDWLQVNTYRHSGSIRNIFPDSSGCHIAFIDDKGEG